MTPTPRAQQIASRVAAGEIPAGDWTTRVRDDIWQGKPMVCPWCLLRGERQPLHIVRGLPARAIATFCCHCDQPGGRR